MSLEINDLSVSFADKKVLQQINLKVEKGEFISLLGASGSGKTTLLKSIAGLVDIDQGQIKIDGQAIEGKEAQDRHLSYVFQDLRLFPHLDVFQNIAFPLKMHAIDRKQWEGRIDQLLADVQMSEFKHASIQSLSGGQQQRIALARALAIEPQLLLLDEPFSGLDENLRFEMGQLIQDLHRKNQLTIIMVTHDKNEAIHYSDRIAILHDGLIHQYDQPERLIYQPQDLFTAQYFGQVNPIDGHVEGQAYLSAWGEWPLAEQWAGQTDLLALFRPMNARLIQDKPLQEGEVLLQARIKAVHPSTQQLMLLGQPLKGEGEWSFFIDNTQDNYRQDWLDQTIDLAVNLDNLIYVSAHS